MLPKPVLRYHNWSLLVSQNVVNSAASNGLLLDGNKPLIESELTCHQWGRATFTWGKLSQDMFKVTLTEMSINYRQIYYQGLMS